MWCRDPLTATRRGNAVWLQHLHHVLLAGDAGAGRDDIKATVSSVPAQGIIGRQ